MAERGLSLRGLCREAGLDPSFFSKVLAGKRSPPSEEGTLRRLAKALELDPAELIVSAGRIPEEWGALWKDPAVFREVRRLVGLAPAPSANAKPEGVRGGSPPGSTAAPPARTSAALRRGSAFQPSSLRPGGLAEELL